MRLKLITCEALYREMCDAVARSPHQVDIEFLPKSLHDQGSAGMRRELQQRVDRVPVGYDAVLLGYGLCGNGLHGLAARSIPLVAPRAHDCITLLLGSSERYLEYFDSHPGTYFRSTGWLERGESATQLARPRSGTTYTLEELVAAYGEENGRYLFDEMTRYQRSYSTLAYIETGLEPDTSFEQRARAEAAARGWTFEKLRGDLSLLYRLVSGAWDAREFLVVPPGARIAARHNRDIISIEEIAPCPPR